MLISLWSDKGGIGKTTVAIHLAEAFRAAVLEMDRQRDILEWAKGADVECEDLAPLDDEPPTQEFLETRAKRLVKAALDDRIWVADSRPGTARANMQAMAYSQIVVIPARTDQRDLRGVVRALEAVKVVRRSGNPDLRAGIVLVAVRDNAWDRNAAQGLQAACLLQNETFLGELKDRTVYKTSYAARKSVLSSRDPAAAAEIRKIADQVSVMINGSVAASF